MLLLFAGNQSETLRYVPMI